MMTTRRLLGLTLAAATLPLLTACGGDGADQRHATDGPAFGASADHLVITTDNGVRLRPADGDRVTVDDRPTDGDRVTTDHDRADRAWSHHGDTWTLDLTCDADHRDGDGSCPRMPRVSVPDGTDVTVRARNAGIDVAGVESALDLTTVNGDVTVTRSGRDDTPVRLATRNGSVRATALHAGRLTATTTNGDVTLACATAPSGVTGTTTNGSVGVSVPHDSPAYRVDAGTDNGRARVDLPARDTGDGPTMTLTTVNGDVGGHTD